MWKSLWKQGVLVFLLLRGCLRDGDIVTAATTCGSTRTHRPRWCVWASTPQGSRTWSARAQKCASWCSGSSSVVRRSPGSWSCPSSRCCRWSRRSTASWWHCWCSRLAALSPLGLWCPWLWSCCQPRRWRSRTPSKLHGAGAALRAYGSSCRWYPASLPAAHLGAGCWRPPWASGSGVWRGAWGRPWGWRWALCWDTGAVLLLRWWPQPGHWRGGTGPAWTTSWAHNLGVGEQHIYLFFPSDYIIDNWHTRLILTGSMGTLATVSNPYNHSRVLQIKEIPTNTETCRLLGECQCTKLSVIDFRHETPEPLHGLDNGPNNFTGV